jgi:hypothetical protein
MKYTNVLDYTGGWFMGNFEPSLVHTPHFEISYKGHWANQRLTPHYHKIGTEYNLIVSGRVEVNGVNLNGNDIFIVEPGDVARLVFHTDTKLIVIKIPSIPGDKYEVPDEPSV